MKQPSSRNLYAYWNELRGNRNAPDRAEIDPRAIRTILPDVFLLGFDASQRYPMRLAGMAVCALFGRELRDTSFLDLCSGETEPTMAKLLQYVIEDATGSVTIVTGYNETGQTLDLELLLLPLTCRDGERARVIGALSAPHPPYWLGVRPLQTLKHGDVRFVGPAVEDPHGRKFVAGEANPLNGPGFVIYPADPTTVNPRNFHG